MKSRFFSLVVAACAAVSAMFCDSAYGEQEISPKEIAMLRQQADRGDAQAQYLLAVCYSMGAGVPQDSVAAAAWCLKAALQGHADAQFNLARCYELGNGVSKNIPEAIRWYRATVANKSAGNAANLAAERLRALGVR